MPAATTAAVKARVASLLHVPEADLPAEWDQIVGDALADALADLLSLLALKGYAGSVSLGSDHFATWQERLATYFALGCPLASYDLKAVEWLDPRKMLTEGAALLVGGEPVAPGSPASDVGGIGSGAVDAVQAARDRFDRL